MSPSLRKISNLRKMIYQYGRNMGYVDIVNVCITLLLFVVALTYIGYYLILVAGFFSKQKTYPTREEKLRYGVIICARNEEDVIGNLIQSVYKCQYPQDKLTVFVMAHNCTDGTAAIARKNGAVVYEYNNAEEKTKGFALKKIFELIARDYGIDSFDGYHIFDADNILDKEYFTKMNDAFLYYDRQCAITSFRNSKNFGKNAQTAMYGILYVLGCTLESVGRMKVGASARILGSGFLVSNKMVEHGWTITNLSDDTDFTIEQVLSGHLVQYCGEAMYYDEHPTKFRDMWRQRLRWAKGTQIVCNKRFSSLIKYIFEPDVKEKRLRWPAYDLLCTILPVGLFGLCVTLLHMCLLAFAPLFGYSAAKVWAGYLIPFAVSFVGGLLLMMVIAAISYIKEKRIKNVSVKIKILSIILYPFFSLLLVAMQVAMLFSKQFAWTQIKHTDTSNYETFNLGQGENHQR